MSLRLFLAPSGVAGLDLFDEIGVDTDRGASYSAWIRGHPMAPAASGDYKLRRLIQWVTLSGDAVVAVTPVADGVAVSDQRYEIPLSLANGPEQRLEVPVSVRGRRFAARVDLVSGVAASAGEAEMVMLPKRSQTGGDV